MAKRRRDKRRSEMEELEPWLLFSADFAGVFAEQQPDGYAAEAPIVEIQPRGASAPAESTIVRSRSLSSSVR